MRLCKACKSKKLTKEELKKEILQLRKNVSNLLATAQNEEQRKIVEKVAKHVFKTTEGAL